MDDREPDVAAVTSNVRGTVSDAAIWDLTREIVTRFDPETIILFGSHASGTASVESDVDLMVVMETPVSEAEQAVRICQAIDYRFGLDLLVRTPETLEQRLGLGDQFIREVLATGRTLYARPHS
jgi:predicted nucleotidyltransferase